MDVILSRNDISHLKQALLNHGYIDIHVMMALDKDAIDSLTYKTPDGAQDLPILIFDKALLSIFFDYVIYKITMVILLEISGQASPRKTSMSSELLPHT
jgi:hypothetical protein